MRYHGFMNSKVTIERKNGTRYHVILRNYGYGLKVGGKVVPGIKGTIVEVQANG